MYVSWITVSLLVLYKVHLDEARIIGRFRRDTSQPHVEAIYNRYKQQSHGEATYYGKYPGGGACSLDPLSPLASQPGWIRVAAGREDFQNSLGCGMCLEITGTGKGKGTDPVTGTLRGIVHDLCGGCKQGDLDLYIPGDGRWEISFKAIDCPNVDGNNGNIMMKFTGSNPWYIKLQARNTRVPVAGIEVLKNGKYSCLKRVNDNYFVGDRLGKVDFPMQVRLTAVTGEQRETIIPSMKNDQDTLTDIQFTGHEAGGGPSSITCMGQGNNPPYPPGGMEPGSPGVSPGQPTPGLRPVPAPAPAPAPIPPTYPPRPENVNFCKRRNGGTYADPERCSGFIICNIGNTHKMTCGDGLLFNTNGMNCDLPGRVDCGDRPLDSPKGNHEDIQGQFGDDPVQESASHGQEEKPLGDRLRNGSLPIREGQSSEGNDYSHEKPKLMAAHFPREDKQPLTTGDTNSPTINEYDDKMDADDTQETPSIQLGVDFREKKKEEKIDDLTQTDTNDVKSISSKEPVLHVMINGDTNLTPMSSSSKSDYETSKSRPSFQIMVNKDGVKASLGRSQEQRKKMEDSSHSESDTRKQKHTFHFIINSDQRKKVNDEVERSNSVASKQEAKVSGGEEERISKPNFELTINNNKDQVISEEDQSRKQLDHHGNNDVQAEKGQEKQGQIMTHGNQDDDRPARVNDIQGKEKPNGQQTESQKPMNEVNSIDKEVKVQNLNVENNGKEPGRDIEQLPMLSPHNRDVSTDTNQNTKAMNSQTSINNVPIKTPGNISDGTSKIGVQGESNNSKEEIQKINNTTQADNQEKVIEVKKIKVKEIETAESNNAQQARLPTRGGANNATKPLGHLPTTSTTIKPIQDSNQESLGFKPPQTVFKHPLEALSYESQRQPAISKEKLTVENGRNKAELTDSSLEHDLIESSGKKINEMNNGKGNEKPEKAMDTSDADNPPQNSGKVNRPTLDILVNGDSGRTTELRMRNGNNEIARLNDAGGKQATNRDPVVGITIRQKGAPDHHILFSKRQRLSNDKLRHRHHKHH